MDVVLSKLEKVAFTVFTSFQNKYLKANRLIYETFHLLASS